jgi:hypothetical protein
MLGKTDRLQITPLLGCLIVVLGNTASVFATPSRSQWNQAEAVRRVQDVVAHEQACDFAWDKIPWRTDPTLALAEARKQNKPIFVYFFLHGKTGPATAPC